MTVRPPTPGFASQSQPLPGATFPVAMRRVWEKYATFSGRASRSEYWWWALVSGVVGVIVLSVYIPSLLAARTGGHGLQINAGIIFVLITGLLWFLATVVPTLALLWRRLHDANLSGYYCLFGVIPTVGWLFVLVFTLLPSNPAGARFDQPTS